MSKVDEETGFILSTPEEILEEAHLYDEENEVEYIPIDNKKTEDTSKKKNDNGDKTVQRLQKRRILLIVFSLAALIVLVSIFRPDKKKKQKKIDTTAVELSVPNFSQQIYESPVTEEIEGVSVIEKLPVYSQSQPLYSQPVATTKGSSVPLTNIQDPTITKAHSSSMIPSIEGRLLGQTAMQTSYLSGNGSTYEKVAVGSMLGQEDYVSGRLAELGGLGSGIGNTNTYIEQNMQNNKQEFYTTGREENPSGSFIGDNTLWNGTIIPGVLITGLNTDLPGDIQARVTENVYDSQTGKNLLIPQGSILIASYNSSISVAQSRVQIAWNTLIRPDGYQVSLGNMNGVDAKGMAGSKGFVDEHFFQYAKAAGIISLFTILNAEFEASTAQLENKTLQDLSAANQGVVNQMSAGIIQRTLDIQPTITVKNGTKINIMLNKNIRIPPIEGFPVTSKYVRK